MEATHAFLSAADVAALEPEVARCFSLLDVWVAEVDGEPAGFMAIGGRTIEALFISPAHMGRGLGTRFIEHACAVLGRDADILVDVNEDNPSATEFYRARGFRRVSRSPTDAAGRPWPILHLALPARTEPA